MEKPAITFIAYIIFLCIYVRFEYLISMRKILYILLIALLTQGCSTSKKLVETKTKTDTQKVSSEVGKETIKRKGDTITYQVPNIIYKDTTIIVRNKSSYGTNILRVAYDKEGNQRIDCVESDLDIVKEWIRNEHENKQEETKIRDKEKESIFSNTTIIYVFLGLAFLLIINKVTNKFI